MMINEIKKKKFSHLHGHSQFSLRDGLGTVEDLVETAAGLGLDNICLTDHGTCGGWFDLAKSCKEKGVKPLFGCELYVTDDRTWHGITKQEEQQLQQKYGRKMTTDEKKRYTKDKAKSYHLIVHAMNDVGIRNLSRIVSDANVNGFYRIPRTDWGFLEQNSDGLYATTACIGGVLAKTLIHKDETGERILDDRSAFERNLASLQRCFPGRFALEMQPNDIAIQQQINRILYECSKKIGAPVVLTQDFHYPRADDALAHQYVKMLDFGVTKKEWRSISSYQYCVLNEDGLFENWCRNGHNDLLGPNVFAEAVSNAIEIGKMINGMPDYSAQKTPVFPLPQGFATTDLYFDHLILSGWNRRFHQMGRGPYHHTHQQYWDQLQKEIAIIKQMGFVDYFLIVQDFVMHAKNQGWAVGPARGSAGGCLVSWVLGITEIDPLRFHLVFERFINPERLKSPDIDSDFSDIDRQRVKQYLRDKYGEDCCSSIVAYSRYSPKSVLLDVARCHEVAPKNVMQISKELDNEKSVSASMEDDAALKSFVYDNGLKDVVPVIDRLDGMIRHATQAAAGMLISNRPIGETTTLRRTGGAETITTEIEGDKLGDAGYLKMDILGIRELSILSDACDAIGKSLNWLYEEVAAEMGDERVWDCFCSGDTLAVFQFGGDGVRELLRNVRPRNIMELATVSALYRPQTLKSGVADAYWKRKHGHEPVVSIHQFVDDIFKDTFNLLVFQEQFIRAFERLGLTYGESDILRRAYEDVAKTQIEKKRKAEKIIDKYREKLKSAGKLPPEELERVMTVLGGEVGYSFNVAHSVAYSIIAYFGQYLKVHHPVQYWVAVLNNEAGQTKNGQPVSLSPFINRLSSFYRQAGKRLEVVVGNINSFSKKFQIVEDSQGNPWLYFPLSAVKGIGDAVVDAMSERAMSHNVPFVSVRDFFEHNGGFVGTSINSSHLKCFAEIGMFDGIPLSGHYQAPLNRRQMLHWVELWCDVRGTKTKREMMYAPATISVKKAVKGTKQKLEAQFSTIDHSLSWSLDDTRKAEHEYCGVVITNNALRNYAAESDQLKRAMMSDYRHAGRTIFVGELVSVEQIDKNGKSRVEMVINTVEDGTVRMSYWLDRNRQAPIGFALFEVYAFVCEKRNGFFNLVEMPTPMSVEGFVGNFQKTA